jgi:hypothetical protein
MEGRQRERCAPPSDRFGSSNDRVSVGVNDRDGETLSNTPLLFDAD